MVWEATSALQETQKPVLHVQHTLLSQSASLRLLLFPVPFARFTREMFHSVQGTFPPGTPAPPIAKVLGKMWKDMSRDQKQPYVAAQEADIAQRLKDRAELIASRPVSSDEVSEMLEALPGGGCM